MGPTKSFFCVWNNPEEIITYEFLPNGETATNPDGSKKIYSIEPTYLSGMTPEEICKNILLQWTNSDPGHRTGAVCYCISNLGLKHVHMVLESDKTMRFTTIKKVFPKMHIEPTKGTKEQAEDYIHKRGKFAEKGEVVLHLEQEGEIKGAQGNRSDLDIIPQMINDGATPNEIMRANFKFRKYEKMIKDAYYDKRAQNTPPLRNVEVDYYYGETGSGKSYRYVELCDEIGEDNIYITPHYENGYLDKYNGQPLLFLNEFRGQVQYGILLSMLEGYKQPVHSRYTDALMLWNKVIFTSPLSPFDLYPNLAKEDKVQQLLRRIKHVIYCYKETNGNKTYYNKIIIDFNETYTKEFLDFEIKQIKNAYAYGKCTDTKIKKMYKFKYTSNKSITKK